MIASKTPANAELVRSDNVSASVPLLEVRGLRISFAGHTVVHGIDFSIAPGEKLALVGESGSGKTVTALSLLGLAAGGATSGRAIFQSSDGPVDLLGLPERRLRGIRGSEIAMIFQEPMTALNPLLTVGAQVAEVLQLKRGLAKAAAWKAAVDLLADTEIPEPGRRAGAYPHQLSGGQRQRAMIAMALACKPRLLLADEPTTALDVALRGQILNLLDALRLRYGMAVLMITHDLNLVRRFADRVAVMQAGCVVEHGTVASVFAAPRHAYTRQLLQARPTRQAQPKGEAFESSGVPLLQATKLKVAYPVPLGGIKGWFRQGAFVAVKDASFTLLQGRTLGVVGESGSGKSTLALASLGLLAHSGQLQVAGQTWNRNRASNLAIRKQVQVVFQDPFSSLSPRQTVCAIVEEGLLVHEPKLDSAGRRSRVLSALADVGMNEDQFPGLLQRYPHEFSGGQRQRLAIARVLVVNPRLLVLDEPTSALDVTIQKQVLELLQHLQHEMGLSYLLITHDIGVIRVMAHDVLVMKDGNIVESGTVQQVLDAPQHPYTQMLVAFSG